MLKNMKLGTKIVSGFIVILLLLCVVVGIGLHGLAGAMIEMK